MRMLVLGLVAAASFAAAANDEPVYTATIDVGDV
jgi:hypothetical protein